jgi:hypothetical protein
VVEGEPVAREGELVLRAALDVLEGKARNAARGDAAQLFNRERAAEVRAAVIAPLDQRLSS